MDQILQAVLLGILQGLTEFLPISSSAHLILIPWMANWDSLGLLFDVFLHAGTMLAVMVYFRKEVREMFLEFREYFRRNLPEEKNASPSGSNLLSVLIIGTIPAGIAALLFRDMIEEYARVPAVTVATLSCFGILLWWADRIGRKCRGFNEIGWKEALIVGIGQAVALVPGVSRSGITITTALLLGFSRRDSARFSFLLSFPILILATLKGSFELFSYPEDFPVGFAALAAGVIISFVSGFFCIKLFLKYLESGSFTPFVLYRFLLAGIILAFLMA